MGRSKLENIEVNLLLDAIAQRYGHDFRNYSKASIKRRINHFLAKTDLGHISEMIPRLLHDESFFQEMVANFSIPVTEMFRDPHFFRAVRKKVFPYLKTYPFVKIWHAGCATGEEVYSMAIMLKEEGLYNKATIFATDFNDSVLAKAKEGIYAVNSAKEFTRNYQMAGGRGSFSEYYRTKYESMIINSSLKQRITFANHNLATDSVFGEMHLVICRNVLIYFDKVLQDRALNLFNNSLVRNGFLTLGSKESLQFSDVQSNFKILDKKWKIFQKKT